MLIDPQQLNKCVLEYIENELHSQSTCLSVKQIRSIIIWFVFIFTQGKLESLRPLCYKNADVFLLCYSVVRPCSFRNLTTKWLPEIRQHCPSMPVVLVGTQLDLREDVQVLIHLAQNQQQPVSTEEGQRLAQELGAASFAECSALTQKNLKDTFDSAILASIQYTESNNIQQQKRLTLRKKTPDKIKSLSETWWRKINCLMGEQSCEFK
ncbi:rho-related GTP-binding protein RhoU-like [Neolamprologus brichardi]|uniref:rho-related GTP-binding protein RhoU-like n=1 Tax=Neolamprologus brichardi TaxID=32507 RepID=UPI0003EBDA7E|nr:rho-related GTP-binding protein RhoU-like [Neolamprologus brichardi]